MSKGTSMDTCVRPEDGLGTAYCDVKVAHKGGEPYPIYDGTTERCVVQNRGSYFFLDSNLLVRFSDIKAGNDGIRTSDQGLPKPSVYLAISLLYEWPRQ